MGHYPPFPLPYPTPAHMCAISYINMIWLCHKIFIIIWKWLKKYKHKSNSLSFHWLEIKRFKKNYNSSIYIISLGSSKWTFLLQQSLPPCYGKGSEIKTTKLVQEMNAERWVDCPVKSVTVLRHMPWQWFTTWGDKRLKGQTETE